MKVLVITNWYPSTSSPNDGTFNERDVQMLKHHHDVKVIHLVRDESETTCDDKIHNGTPVKCLIFARKYPLKSFSTIIKIRRASHSVDLVHSMAFPALFPIWSSRLFDKSRVPWLHTEHWSGLLLRDENHFFEFLKSVFKNLLKAPNHVVAVGENLSNEILRYRNKQSQVIGNEVRLPNKRVVNRNFIDIGNGPLNIVSVGSLTNIKGPVESLLALAVLRNRGIDARLRWIGVGELREELTILSNHLNLNHYFTLTGLLSPEEVSNELSRADVFLLPSVVETFGIALAEAMAHGLPIVTGVDVNKSFLLPSFSRFIPNRDPNVIADAVIEILNCTNRLSATEVSELAKSLFSERKRVEDYKIAYAEAICSTNKKFNISKQNKNRAKTVL